MLIQFSVGNFRSIREEQTLSMVASHDTGLSQNLVVDAGFRGALLRQVAIYGANAAGKSNLLLALESLRQMVNVSALLQEGQALPWITPYRLDKETDTQATRFTLVFLLEGVRYQYEVAATAQRVLYEALTAWPQSRPQVWYTRAVDAESQESWKFGSHFKGEKRQRHLWQTSTRTNGLFLSTAVQLNNSQLKPVFHWITQQLIVIVPGKTDFNPALSLERMVSEVDKARLMAILSAADVGIQSLDLRDMEEQSVLPLTFIQAPFQQTQPPKWQKIVSIRERSDGRTVEFDFGDESDGTRKLFEFAGGWLRALDSGATLLVDEIDRSLHPHLVQMLVKLFGAASNPRNAQLIFTTHDTALLDAALLRRDQIWFVEKKQGATRLYSLLEFSPRKHEAVERGYLLGRYGAIPFVSEPRWQHG
ncbi:ATP/GTP-binding protein [uncultured Thiothrix sp.]|uniref:AAA family ATPase n=1 Tax=uncultured Thiothrix sp. TaxID=223185 RepID=UPI0026229660|nr:ATP-binding protein [uncultured Thiothrix sp.]HMT91589.1 ATP-binding protein [Thiolinea sp.]